MKLSLVLPIYKTLHESKGILGLLREMTSNNAEWVVIDNGTNGECQPFFEKHIRPEKVVYVNNEENMGMVKTIQQGYERSTGDVVVFLHNDVYLYREDWDEYVLDIFREHEDIGGVGLFGSQGVYVNGGRMQDVPAGFAAGWSNMLEAELHGVRMQAKMEYVSIFDGYFMAFRRTVLDAVGGIDQRYKYHHLYDRDMSLEVLRHGYKNAVIDLPSHHASGMTANRPEYQAWITERLRSEGLSLEDNKGDSWTHDENTRIFTEKWGDVLPLYVERDGSYRRGPAVHGYEYKGDAIAHFKPEEK